jgi:lysozyme
MNRMVALVLFFISLTTSSAVSPVLGDPPPVYYGLDISKYAGVPPVSTWQQINDDGWAVVVVGAWGSYGVNPFARDQLANANQAGMLTAAYCLLHWDRDSYGGWQVAQALNAVGDQVENLAFMAIDVETGGGPVDPEVDPVARIDAAVGAVWDAGLTPIIYTNRNSWNTLTGGTTAFSDLALWFARYDGRDELNTDGDGAWIPIGGWTYQSGKQYQPNMRVRGVNADLNVFLVDLFP